MCALRIPNGGGNVLIDNIESDSTPVIYTRRSRFLDEELDETKDIITTTTTASPYPNDNNAEQRTYHKISMLMSDGVVTAMPNELKTDPHKVNHIVSLDDAVIVAQNYNNECSQRDDCDQPNQNYCTNITHITSDSIGLDRAYNGLTLNECDLGQNIVITDPLNDVNDLNEQIGDSNNKQTSQILHIHQFRPQPHPLTLIDETSMLRRQQLSRVAEWVQNNNREACIGNPDADFKPITKLNNNSDEISNCSVDRNLKTSLSMINCNNVAINDLEAGKLHSTF